MSTSRYARVRIANLVQETVAVSRSEIEIQARLFAGEYGTRWMTTAGEEVEVLHFGQWNREAGPDFRGARLRIGEQGECSGDIEVDTDARDWERHGHATNPAYNGVRLQLFVNHSEVAAFARTEDFREVPQAHLEVEVPVSARLAGLPGSVDLASAEVMVEEAAEFRLRMKHAAHARAVALHGAGTALFHAIATGLGYKNNGIPFLLAAQRTGLRAAMAGGGEARLFGLAGFLHARTFDEGDPVTRDYLRPLWEEWWGMRDGLVRLILPGGLWKYSGIRPSNHPHRRMGALAATGAGFEGLMDSIAAEGKSGFVKFFEALDHRFWSRHWNLSAATLEGDLALVGPDRVRDLLINAYFPSLPLDQARAETKVLRGGTPSGRLKSASLWLLGRVDLSLMRSARQQQGLLQLFKDFGSLSALEAWGKIRSDGPGGG